MTWEQDMQRDQDAALEELLGEKMPPRLDQRVDRTSDFQRALKEEVERIDRYLFGDPEQTPKELVGLQEIVGVSDICKGTPFAQSQVYWNGNQPLSYDMVKATYDKAAEEYRVLRTDLPPRRK